MTSHDHLTPGQARIAKATKVRMRVAEEKLAARLRERGWVCIPPEETGREGK